MSRATLWDRVRTLLDFTPYMGRLQRQDDLGFSVKELPFDRMVRRARELGITVHDLRQYPRLGKHKRGSAKGTRNITDISTVLFHQMAAVINDPMRCLGIPSHGAIVRNGDIVLQQPLRAHMWHANAANKFSIGIEIAARAAGIDGDPRTFWRTKNERNGYTDKRGIRHPPKTYDDVGAEVTHKQIQAANILADYYIEETERQGGQIDHTMDHRNSHKSRVGCPGSRIHKHCTAATAWRHILTHHEPVGSGKPNPEAWSGKPGERYSWNVDATGGQA